MNRYLVSINGKEVELTLLRREGNRVEFMVGNQRHSVEASPLLKQPSVQLGGGTVATPFTPPATPSSRKGGKPGEVCSPMPGVVVNLPIQVGSKVEAGQTVAVIEAMKMENNISSPLSGTIKEISVKAGQEVNADQILLTIKKE